MSNAFYAPGPQRAAKVGHLFTSIARRYDFINDLQSLGLHRRWKRQMLDLAAAQQGLRALDVCCGTGDIAFSLAARGAEVSALDFSEAMLSVARTKVGKFMQNARTHVAPPQFLHGDAEHIPFPDATFDIVTVGYGLRNLSHWKTGLAQMSRVAKPGGRLLVLDFGKPDFAPWRAIYFGYLKLVVPLLGLAFCRNASAYAYILESLKHYPAQRGVAAWMHKAGLQNVRVLNLLGGAMSINLGVKPPA